MNIISNLNDIRRDKNSFITIGTFDGIHRAHQIIISKLVEESKLNNGRGVLITFEPHPRIVINGNDKIKILTDLNEKIEILNRFNIDVLLILRFDNEFAGMLPEAFIQKILFEKVGMSELIVGFDHSFGKGRGGNNDTLLQFGIDLGYKVLKMDPVLENGEKISSTKIRHFLLDGNLQKANNFLGWNYSISGKVAVGDKRGSQIGYPTANIELNNPNKLIPKNGVYFVKIYVEGKNYFGFLNIGTRPTFTESTEVFIETHIFNFSKDIYEKEIKVEFLNYIREEKKFNSVKELLEQIEIDKAYCTSLINKL